MVHFGLLVAAVPKRGYTKRVNWVRLSEICAHELTFVCQWTLSTSVCPWTWATLFCISMDLDYLYLSMDLVYVCMTKGRNASYMLNTSLLSSGYQRPAKQCLKPVCLNANLPLFLQFPTPPGRRKTASSPTVPHGSPPRWCEGQDRGHGAGDQRGLPAALLPVQGLQREEGAGTTARSCRPCAGGATLPGTCSQPQQPAARGAQV